MQAIITVFSWLSHFSQCYILLKCNNSGTEECVHGLEDDVYTGTSISESMVYPTCVNMNPNRYDYLAYVTIHMVFCKFIYMLYHIFTKPSMIFHNRGKSIDILLTKIGIIICSTGIYVMYFTTYTKEPLKSEPSTLRNVLTTIHICCVGLIINGSLLFCYQIIKVINQRVYNIVSYLYFLTMIVLSIIFIHKYKVNGKNEAMRFMNIGEWEILYFTYVYYLLSIVLYENGDIKDTYKNKLQIMAIVMCNFIIGPICYSCINCLI